MLGLLPVLVLHPAFLVVACIAWVASVWAAFSSASRLTGKGHASPDLLTSRRAARVNATLIAVNTGLGLFACLTTYGVRGDTTSVRSVLSSLFVWLAVAVLPFIIGSYLVSVAYLIAAGEVRSTAAPFVGGLLAWIVVSPPLMLGLWAASVFAFVRATYPGGVSPV